MLYTKLHICKTFPYLKESIFILEELKWEHYPVLFDSGHAFQGMKLWKWSLKEQREVVIAQLNRNLFQKKEWRDDLGDT